MKTPLVSVIIPVYNSAPFIKTCLQSVLTQSYAHVEICVVDDGSTDGSQEIVRDCAHTDERVRVYVQEHQGVGAARNMGLQQALGQYVLFVDADDVLHPQGVEQAVLAAQHQDAQLVVWPYVSFRKEVLFEPVSKEFSEACVTDNPLLWGSKRIHYVVWGKLYQKSVLEGIWFSQEPVFEDVPFIYEVLARKPKTVLLRDALYAYRERVGSLSNQTLKAWQIPACRKAVLQVTRLFADPQLKAERDFVQKDFIPRILKDQLYRCRHADPEERTEMFQVFTKELRELEQTGWLTCAGHRFYRYVYYQYLLVKNKYLLRNHPCMM